MTAVVYHAIRCDQPGCDAEETSPKPVWNASELRGGLRKAGWKRTRDHRDLCPKHAKPR